MKAIKGRLLNRRLRAAIGTIAVLFGLAALAGGVEAAEKTYHFKWANYSGPATHVEVAHSIQIMKKLEEASNGRMKFKNYMSGSLVAGADMVEGTRVGITDFATAYFPYHVGINPLFGVDNLPGLWSDIPHAIRAQADIERINFWNKHLLNSLNIQLLGIYIEGPSWLLGRKNEIRVPADVKGLKVRCYGPLEDFFSSQGATPIHLTAGDLYESLMRGVVDGMTLTPGTVMTRKIYEVIDHMMAYPVTISEGCTWMNLDIWKKMTPQDQELVQKTIMDMHQQFSRKTLANVTRGSEMLDFLSKRVNMYEIKPEEVSQWVEALQPVRDKYVSGLKPESQKTYELYQAKIVKKHAKQ